MAQTKIKQRQISGGLDGWIPAEQTWTYASATTITVPSGAASLYQKGDKIKLTQTTVKYFYIVGVADTVLTVTGGTDYTVANATITAPYISKADNPQGFPHWFNYTPTFSALAPMTWGSTSITVAKFCIHGNMCSLQVYATGTTSGTASTSVYLTAPVTCAVSYAALGGHTYWNASARVAAYVLFNNSTTSITVRKYDWSAFGISAGVDVGIGGTYPI